MPITPAKIRDLLIANKYENYAVEDIKAFPQCIPHTSEGDQAIKRFNTWEKMPKSASSGGLAPGAISTARTFITHSQILQGTPENLKSAECSRFAKLAIGNVLLNPDITEKYNIVLAGIMGGMHNIAILIPKNSEFDPKSDAVRNGILPAGTLIIDPWARALGYPAEKSLATSAQNFAFSESLPGMTVHYQSKNDLTVDDCQKAKALLITSVTNGSSQLNDPVAARKLERALRAQAERDAVSASAGGHHVERPSSASQVFNDQRGDDPQRHRSILSSLIAQGGPLGQPRRSVAPVASVEAPRDVVVPESRVPDPQEPSVSMAQTMESNNSWWPSFALATASVAFVASGIIAIGSQLGSLTTSTPENDTTPRM